ncbi:MAG TPA: aminotransferase class I/II-fold pyridoxal phosphate-dependent enzyme [Candidatus Eremiobacteraceae bacterium]|nr:aminotransferase class I/II-fold pyridoxal phosphate-dependent enzyme [Candidatus Eremiobacteraceae bacterium]
MPRLDQSRTPYFDALRAYVDDGVTSFHTPGHKHGRGMHRRLKDFIGENVLKIDLTQVLGLDDLNQPESAIKEAHELAADAYGADYSYFLINGSTAGNQAMLMTALRPDDIVLIPRNSHKSAVSALIMSAARPIYMQPAVDHDLHIDHAVTVETVKNGLDQHADAKAVFLTSPTYYGSAADVAAIERLVHSRGKMLLVDEAWGSHLHFHPELPQSSTSAKVDACVNSTHKLTGAMSQCAMLHTVGDRIDRGRLRSTLRIFQSTSPQLAMLASLDVARMQLATEGEQLLTKALALARDARERLNKVPGVFCMGTEHVGRPGIAAYDETRLVITVKDLGYTGYEASNVLRLRYKVQADMADLCNVVALVTFGDTEESIDALVNAVEQLARDEKPSGSESASAVLEHRMRHGTYAMPPIPAMVLTPREAFTRDHVEVPFRNSAGRICAEVITPYPPGIPIICPGERIDDETIDYLQTEMHAGVHIQGPVDEKLRNIRVLP